MKISLLQLNTQWMDASANIRSAERLMELAPDSDLYVLPEMWATGFCTEPTLDTAEQAHIALEWMHQTARQRNCAVAGTLPVRSWPEEDVPSGTAMWRNRFYFVRTDGSEQYYDKRHLFTPAGEHLTYAPGKERVIVTYRGLRFMLQTCFDLRFPECGRNLAASTYDILLYAACWPQPRIEAWTALLRARAIENQTCCIGVNRTGTDPACIYNGHSAAFDAYGRRLAEADEAEQVLTICPDIEHQQRLRSKFRVIF